MNWFSISNKIRCRSKRKLLAKKGMTMAELLIVVAIIVVLAGVAFIAVNNYQRSMAQLERDGIAKEIFVAAQNHLRAAQEQGYLGTETYGSKGSYSETIDGSSEVISDTDNKIYYYIVSNGVASDGATDIFKLMLPFGSIDETVRGGGSYLIRYQPETATVLDVFYCSLSEPPAKFDCNLANITDVYTSVMDLRNDKDGRRTYVAGGGSVLGYYGGADAGTIATLVLKDPKIEVINDDKLRVIITDDISNSNKYSGKYSLKLIISGDLSQAQKSYIVLKSTKSGETVETDRLEFGSKYTIILDDITAAGKHFFEIQGEAKDSNGSIKEFIPGENITVQAVAYSTEEYSNIAYSTIKRTNSLFYDGSTATKAQISSIRHLENLDKNVSNLDAFDNGSLLNINAAVQVKNLDWPSFNGGPVVIYGHDGLDRSVPLTKSAGYYYPIEPDYSLTYDGKGMYIKNIQANSSQISSGYARDNAGLFGSVSNSKASSISNLELIDFSIAGTTSAGALAGSLSNCTVTNVLARNSTNAATTNITATSGAAGGLIGNMSGTVQYSAAALIVNGGTTAGGLIGDASGSIIGCYSGGHTSNGSYQAWIDLPNHPYDVTGAIAGGLVGSASAAISNSYSTCSVSGTTKAGGFVGNVTGDYIKNCYATGMIDPAGANNYAFIASETPTTFSNNYYYMTINEIEVTDDETGKTTIEPMRPYSAEGEHELSEYFPHTKPFDLNASFYNKFVGSFSAWDSAKVYDASLLKYYSGKYPFRTVLQLPDTETKSASTANYFVSRHYGDWPAPEIFFLNTPAA